jgi:phage-related protein
LTLYHFWYSLSDDTAWGGTVGYAKESPRRFLPNAAGQGAGERLYPQPRTRGQAHYRRRIATVEFGWPVGKPTCAPLGSGLWEIRSDLTSRRIVRVLFMLHQSQMVLLHGFIKKTQKTPRSDLDIARERMKEISR